MASTCEDCAPVDAPQPAESSAPAPKPDQPQPPATVDASVCSNSYPRIVITYCTQCRWMLRAAYFAQELLSTFGTAIGEIALKPATGGIFTVHLTYHAHPDTESSDPRPTHALLWDRKAEGGFPETKVLKQRLRDHIEPNRDLGHSDRHGKSTGGS